MNRFAAAVLGLSITMVGCASNVEEDVQQIPDQPPQREAPAQTFGGDLRIGVTDPVMQAIVDQNNNGAGDLGAKQLAVQSPLPSGK